jgi:uncharacterized protein (TIGR02271 family)
MSRLAEGATFISEITEDGTMTGTQGTGPAGKTWQIEDGWDVFAADGQKVGDVKEARGTYFVVSKGALFPKELYIPATAITGVEQDRVNLNVPKDLIEAHGWDRPPEAGAESGARPETERSMRFREEELRARKQPVQTGEARIGKEVVSEEKTMEVPRTREEVYVERRPVDRRPADKPIGEGQDQTIEVPVREERVTAEKEPVVYEEVDVGKRRTQETERVSGTVRREEPRIEKEGDVDVGGEQPRR